MKTELDEALVAKYPKIEYKGTNTHFQAVFDGFFVVFLQQKAK